MTQRAHEPLELARIVAAAIADRLRGHEPSTDGAIDVQSAVGDALTTPAAPYRVTACHVEADRQTSVAVVVIVLERAPSRAELSGRLIERYSMTPREAAAAALVARRYSTAEVARALGISVHTARHHTERVLTKLGVRSRAEAAEKLAAELG
jgi:DNA-binding CsgD family transcriptional regulator